jgi:lipooligosaccharide transport system permease protein
VTLITRAIPTPVRARRRPWRMVERNVVAYRRTWYIFLSGFLEPILFLFSIGIGVGHLVGGLKVGNVTVDYSTFVAPGLLATAAMNGALLDTTFNFFFKYKYSHTYDGVIATPLEPRDIALGESTWSLLRGAIYSAAFLVTMAILGDVASWWALLAVPVAVLLAFAFAGAGLAAAGFMRSWLDFDYINMAMIPLFLFSAVFFPLSQYSAGVQWIIRFTPLYQGVVLERGLCVGELHWTMVLNALYLAVMGTVGVRIAVTRLGVLLKH